MFQSLKVWYTTHERVSTFSLTVVLFVFRRCLTVSTYNNIVVRPSSSVSNKDVIVDNLSLTTLFLSSSTVT